VILKQARISVIYYKQF